MQDIGFLAFLAICWWGAGVCGAGYHYASWQAQAGADARAQRGRHRWRALAWSLTGLGAVIFASGLCEYGWWHWPGARPCGPTAPSAVGGEGHQETARAPSAPARVGVYTRPRLIRGASVGTVRDPARSRPRQGDDQHDNVRSAHDGDHPAA